MLLKRLKSIPWIAVIIVVISACNLPGRTAPTPFVFPTPDLTLTALFASVATQETAMPTPTATASTTVVSPTSTQPAPTETSIPPTATAIPSATPTSTPISYAGPGVRPGPRIKANYLQREPTIDGVFDEWFLDRYAVANVVYGRGNWSGEKDLYANVMVGWDDYNLYLAAKVKDDAYVQKATAEELFRGDSIEILVDTVVSNDFYHQALSNDDFQLGISPGKDAPGTDTEAYLWYPRGSAGSKVKVKAAATTTDNGYRIEVKIPWELLGVTPFKGQHFGFAFSVSDNDKAGTKAQQSMVSNITNRILTDPTTWGDLVLIGQEKNAPTATPKPNPNARSGPSVTASHLGVAPTIDGDLGEWSLGAFAIDEVVFGAGLRTDAADLSGSAMLGWDSSNLYVGATVKDDVYVQNASGAQLFKGDSLELLLDRQVADDYYDDSLSPDDYQLGISPGQGTPGSSPESYLWYPAANAGAPAGVQIAAKATADGYQVEAAIPWSIFGITPAENQHYGFALSISDNDLVGDTAQQSMVSNVVTRLLNDPTTWGDLTLGG